MNLTESLAGTAGRWPQKTALIEGEVVISYAGLVEKIAGFAAQLQSLGVAAGSRIGLSSPNSINYVALTYALWSVNVVVVPIPVECTGTEAAALAGAMSLAAVISHQPRAGSEPLGDVFFTCLQPAPPADNHGLNLAFIRFTSGTTSARKGVALSHESIRDRVAATNKALGIGPDDTVIWCLPMSHHFLATIVLYLSVGATVVLARHLFARPFLEAVNRRRGTVLYAAPFHYAMLARDASGAMLASARLAVSTTCSLPQEVAVDFQRRFGLRLTQALGVIELGLICVNDDPVGRWDSAGRPQPDYAVHIRHPDADGYGEVVFAGPGFFDAYANPWTCREQLMPDGWFATGDLGRVDAQGYLYLAGRKASVINLAGRKVFPEEIEAVLNRHPGVVESRAYGVPHPQLGEVVAAEVVLRAATLPGALAEFCRAQLSADKVPGRFVVVAAIAKTAVTGKILRPAAPAIS